MAILLASTLWFYVLNSEPIILEKRVPLRFMTPEGMTIENIVDRSVELRLQGARAFMQNIFTANEEVTINLTAYDFRPGNAFEVRITPFDVPLPFGVDVLEIRPSQMEIVLGPELKKKVKVTPLFIGALAEGLRFTRQELSLLEVEVRGPRNMVRGLEKIRTSSIDLSQLRSGGSVEVSLMTPDPRIELINGERASFVYEIRPQEANLTLGQIPVHFISSAKEFKAAQRHVALDVMATDSISRPLRPDQVRITGEIPDGVEGKVRVRLSAQLPEGVYLMKIHPETIEVDVILGN